MTTADDWIDRGLDAHQNGRPDAAAAAYGEALALDPDHPDALNLSGVLAHQRGDPAEAVRLIGRAIELDPDAADFHANLAEAHRAGHRVAAAIDAYAKSAHLDGTNAAVWANLATLLQQTGRFAEAVGAWKHATEIDPSSADYFNNYGRALTHAGRPAEAVPLLERAVALKPDLRTAIENLADANIQAGRKDEAVAAARRHVDAHEADAAAWTFLATVCNDAGRPHDALDAAREAIRLDSALPNAHFVMGQTLEKMGEAAGASLAYAKVTELRPDLAEGHASMGLAALSSGRLDRAAGAFTEATQLRPEYPEAWFNLAVTHDRMGDYNRAIEFAEKARALLPTWGLVGTLIGNLHLKLGHHAEAEAEFRRVLDDQPDFVPALAGLGNVQGDRGDHAAAEPYLRRALAADPTDPSARSVMLMAMIADGTSTPDAIAAAHRTFGDTFDRPLLPFANTRDPARRIRIGYLSPDFRAHSVSFFLGGLLQHHDHGAFEVIAYDDTARPDVISQVLRGQCDRWHRVVGMSQDRLAELIREHEVDILVDLTGHTSANRLKMFATKPAPVQVSYLGYPASTGLKSVDYRFTDALADPPGLTDAHHTEKLVRLPGLFIAYSPPPMAPNVSPLPALTSGYVTFASFNATNKLHRGVYDLWARVLHAVPDSRLILKANGFADAVLRDRVTKQFAGHGIAPDRVTLLAKTVTMVDHLNVYNRCDLALDSFPYNGTTTTCEAMWMGLPTVTLAGQMHAGRVGVSLMTNAGLPDWIAQNSDDYVAVAARMAADLPRLAALRAGLRSRMAESPVMDAQGLTRHIESAYRTMWQDYCRTAGDTPASSTAR